MARPGPQLTRDDLPRLFREHAAGLAGAVRGILGPGADAQELLQEAFLRAWQALARGARPADPAAWVFVLVINLARDQRRSTSRRGRPTNLDDMDAMQLETRELEPATSLHLREALAAAREAIFRLEEKEQEVFLLRVSGGLPFEAVAAVLGLPVGTVKTRMRSALGRLRQRLRGFAPELRSAGGASGRGLGAQGETR